jgi:tetratricopeptide (TPR) repeat protein
MMYVQKNPQNQAFDDLLMWVFIQQKKFSAAFRHAVSIDKRTKSDGKGVFELAKICKDNKDYEAAEKCYQYLIDRGQDNFYFVNAKMGLLESSYAKMRMNPLVEDTEIQSIVNSYNSFLTDFGRDWNTAGSMKELADIYLFYLHDLNKGMSVLNELVNIPRLKPNQRAEYKLALADAYVIKGEVWEATLLYGQVDKEFKEDPLGQEAKFRNARLSYFRGDFEWAKDQLDILKTATSQLISNNAIELALLIQDNTGLDSTTEALGEYAHAQLLLFQNKLDECLEVLNMLPFKYPNHSLEDEIYFSKAQVMEAKKDFLKAETYYLSVIELFPEDILADNAVYSLGKLYELKLNDQKKAADMYEKLLFDYTGSLFAVDARKRYKKIQEMLEASPVSP